LPVAVSELSVFESAYGALNPAMSGVVYSICAKVTVTGYREADGSQRRMSKADNAKRRVRDADARYLHFIGG